MASASYLQQQLREVKRKHQEELSRRDAMEQGLAYRNRELQAVINRTYDMLQEDKSKTDVLISITPYQRPH